MAPSKEMVLERLARVPSPDGTPLTTTGKLSDVVVSDGKVFFSISVDAASSVYRSTMCTWRIFSGGLPLTLGNSGGSLERQVTLPI